MLSDEGLLENPRILEMMDNDLTISIADFCLFFKLTKNIVFNQQNLIEELSKSKLLLFNYSKGEIQRRVKGKRRILLFHEIPNGISIPSLLKELNLLNKAEKIDESKGGLVEVYFESETEAFNTASFIERIRWDKVKNNFTQKLDFRCQVKCESFKSEISSKLYLKQEKKPEHTKSVEESIFIILDKENYHPRFHAPEQYYDNRFNIGKQTSKQETSAKDSFQSISNDGETNLSTKEDSVEYDYKEKKRQALAKLNEIYSLMKTRNVNMSMPLVLEKNFNESVMEKNVVNGTDALKNGLVLKKGKKFSPQGKKKNYFKKYWKKSYGY